MRVEVWRQYLEGINMAVPSSLILGILLWLLRTFISSLICLALGLLGIRMLTSITTEIKEFKAIRHNAEATALFVGGFLIFAGLVIHGSSLNPIFLGQSIIIGSYFSLQRLLTVILSVIVSFFFGWFFYIIFAKISPMGIDLDDINKSPIAIGAFLFSYEVFLGLIIHASLSIPL
ncbi:hypothetical protein KAS14_02780 [Candidatus Bathyarchaeota archaeon]|nr:hypothetical protein [Candidatus Bathyarchaeota archaeon]